MPVLKKLVDDTRLKDIIASGKTCYFISPHYDDMAYSASMLASELAKTNRIVVITVFTSGSDGPYTRAAKYWMERCGYTNADQFFADRRTENKLALRSLADEVIDFGFADVPWRKKPGHIAAFLSKLAPEFGNIRGSLAYRFYARKDNATKADSYNFNLIREKLETIIPIENSQVLCPLGVGKHFDHLMTRQVCDALFSDPIYWADYPYNLENAPTKTDSMHTFRYNNNPTAKRTIIEAYASQYDAMFGTEEPQIIDETFYYKEEQL